MYYIVQENTFREENYNLLIQSLEKLGLEYEIVKVLPFIDTVDFKTNRKDVFVFGALKLAKISKQEEWTPGSLMTLNHDYMIYKDFYREHLLNYDSKIHKFGFSFDWDSQYKFIRPTEDTKVFNGKVYDEIEWKEFVQYSMTNGHSTVLNEDTYIQVSTPKEIHKEIRFWVVNGKIITGSQYRLRNMAVADSNIDIAAIEFAQKMVDIYQLADAFVIDVCLSNNEWKIVECGCINCAGFYHADLMKVLIALENFYNPEQLNNNNNV